MGTHVAVPCPEFGDTSPVLPLASRTGESHSSDAAILRIKGVMAWMEQQFTASATAYKSLAAHVAPSVPGESISFHSIMNCRNIAYVVRFLFNLFS